MEVSNKYCPTHGYTRCEKHDLHIIIKILICFVFFPAILYFLFCPKTWVCSTCGNVAYDNEAKYEESKYRKRVWTLGAVLKLIGAFLLFCMLLGAVVDAVK